MFCLLTDNTFRLKELHQEYHVDNSRYVNLLSYLDNTNCRNRARSGKGGTKSRKTLDQIADQGVSTKPWSYLIWDQREMNSTFPFNWTQQIGFNRIMTRVPTIIRDTITLFHRHTEFRNGVIRQYYVVHGLQELDCNAVALMFWTLLYFERIAALCGQKLYGFDLYFLNFWCCQICRQVQLYFDKRFRKFSFSF